MYPKSICTVSCVALTQADVGGGGAAQIYTAQMVLDCMRAYNAAAEVLPLLPAPDAVVADELPPMLACDWRDSLPAVRSVPFHAGAMPQVPRHTQSVSDCMPRLCGLVDVSSLWRRVFAGESWEARCTAAWKQHGLSVATPQQQPAVLQKPAADGPVSVASGGELGVRVDRRQFAKRQAALPQLSLLVEVISWLLSKSRLLIEISFGGVQIP